MKSLLAAFTALLISVSLLGSGSTAYADATVSVSLTDYAVAASPSTVAPGTITFNASNDAPIIHDFYVIQTDLAQGALPIDGNTATVDLAQLNVVGSMQTIQPGGSDSIAVDMAAGAYVLICNLPSHYEAGMHRAFTVAQAPANTNTPGPGQPTATLAPGETPSAVATDDTGGTVDGPVTGYGPSGPGSSSGPLLMVVGLGALGLLLGAIALRRMTREA